MLALLIIIELYNFIRDTHECDHTFPSQVHEILQNMGFDRNSIPNLRYFKEKLERYTKSARVLTVTRLLILLMSSPGS